MAHEEVVVQTVSTRFWCIVCGGTFMNPDVFQYHYDVFHPKFKIDCDVCLNSFRNEADYEFHARQMHHRGVPFEFVVQAFGNNLFQDVTPKEFHRLKRNGITVPGNMEEPPVPSDDAGYLELEENTYLLMADLKTRKKLQNVVKRGVKKMATKVIQGLAFR